MWIGRVPSPTLPLRLKACQAARGRLGRWLPGLDVCARSSPLEELVVSEQAAAEPECDAGGYE